MIRKKSLLQKEILYAYEISTNKLIQIQLEKRVDNLLKNKFNLSEETIKQIKTSRMLDDQVGLSSIQLTEIFFELEKEFSIEFNKNDVINNQFDNYDVLIQIIENKMYTAEGCYD